MDYQRITVGVLAIFLLLVSCSSPKNNQKIHTPKTEQFDDVVDEVKKKMEEVKLHGLSVAVFENYQLTWVHQWGIKAAGSPDQVDENTAFSTASISKPVTALLCARLEEKGLIDLDESITKYLKRWQLPKSELTKDIEVTWLHLLSHTAGTSQGGFADFYEGDTLPTIVQSLKGERVPRYDREIGFLFKPGTDHQYSGGGYVIVQLALEDHFKRSLADLAQEYIFSPLGLKNTTMKQPHELGFLKNVAKVHDKSGNIIRTGLPITPQVAPSGMWSCPADLAKLALEVQNALRNHNNKVFSNAVAKRVTNIATLKRLGSWSGGGWSHGFQRSLGYGNMEWFGHGGSNTGVGGELLATMEGGNGIVIMANGDRPNRNPMINYLKAKILSSKGWGKSIDQLKKEKMPQVLKESLLGVYVDFLHNRRGILQILESDGKLWMKANGFKHWYGTDQLELIYMSDHTFKLDNYPNYLQVELDHKNHLKTLGIYRDDHQKNKVVLMRESLINETSQVYEAFLNEDFQQATDAYKSIKAHSSKENFEDVLNQLSYQFYQEGNLVRTFEILRLNCQENPHSWKAYDNLAETFKYAGQLKEAIKHYQKAISLNADEDYKKQVRKLIAEMESELAN